MVGSMRSRRCSFSAFERADLVSAHEPAVGRDVGRQVAANRRSIFDEVVVRVVGMGLPAQVYPRPME